MECGNPIDAGRGRKVQTERDYLGSGDSPLQFARYYDSSSSPANWTHAYSSSIAANLSTALPPAGVTRSPPQISAADACVIGWAAVKTSAATPSLQQSTATYENNNCTLRSAGGKLLGYTNVYSDQPLTPAAQSTISVTVQRPQNSRLLFTKNGSGSFVADGDTDDRLTQAADGSYTLKTHDDDTEVYSAAGKLLSITDRAGRQQILSYDAQGRLDTVTDSWGHTLLFNYDAQNRLSTLTTPDGPISYTYDTAGNIASVQYPDGKTKQYLYENTSFPNALTGITDENGARFATWTYDANGYATSSQHAGGAELTTVNYTLDSSGGITGAAVTDALGTTRNYGISQVLDVAKFSSISQPGAPGARGAASVTYDANGNLASRTDFNGHLTTYVHDARNLETSRTEASGTAQARTITTSYHPTFRLPVQIDEPGRRTTFTYDASGNLLSKTVTDTATSASRTWAWTYNSFGQPLTMNGPRTDVSDLTTYTYNNCISGGGCGQINTISNARGHVTTITSYDANGRPLSITDANNVVTDLTYSPRGWLTSRKVGGVTTTYTYDSAGQMTKITLPDASFITYTYDAAHRLTDLADNLGNKIHYTLDAMGNRTKEEVFDPSSVLRKTQSQVFDALSRLKEIRGANGQLTEYGYDPQGNRTSDRQASAFTTLSEYDALDRLNKTTDAAGGITQYSYNALDQLTGVTDPKSLSTSYTYNALGDLTQLQSPDTGTTSYTYDSGGNRKTQLDARGITATYSYDSLNRITAVDYPGTAEDVSYSYDAGSNGSGRLTGISDQSGTTAYVYDPRGTLKTQAVTVSTKTYTTSYLYDAADHLTGMTYPSGRVVSYVRDTLGRISQVSATVGGTSTPIESGIQYLPFGPWTQANLGNGIAASRSFDQDYRITALTAGTALSRAYDQYDTRNNLKHIADGLSAGKSQSFGYDALSRLSSASGGYGSLSWTYADATGDRKTQTRGTAVGTYTYPAASHRLSAITGDGAQSFTYDNAGNTTQIGSTLYDRNSAGRLSQIRTPACTQMVGSLCLQQGTAVAATYTYNALGQRVSKSGTVYQYDQSGNLMSESTSAGINQRDYVYADGQLIAIVIAGSPAVCTQSIGSICLQQSPAVPEQIHYAHLDHLGTPQAFTNQAKAVTWAGDYEPFGKATVTTSTLTSNIRLPGQYFDTETGQHQNWFRDYSPSIGRYIEFDPLGLPAGINGYGYGFQNPVSNTDPKGLAVPLAIGACLLDPPCAAAAAAGIYVAAQAIKDAAKATADTVAKACEDKKDDCMQPNSVYHVRSIGSRTYSPIFYKDIPLGAIITSPEVPKSCGTVIREAMSPVGGSRIYDLQK